MRRHGATVVGGSLRELVFRTIYSAKNAEHQLAAHMLGHVSPLTDGEADMAGEINLAPGPLARAYEYWVRRLAEREGRGESDPMLRAAEAAARLPVPAKRLQRKKAGAKKKSAKGERMKHSKFGCALIALALGATQALAQDTLKIAIGQINNWENQAPTLGEDAGIFKKHNLKIEAFGTQGAGETIQAVISGSRRSRRRRRRRRRDARVLRARRCACCCRRSPAPAISTGM